MIILDGSRISWNVAHISPVVSKSSIPFRDRMKNKNDNKNERRKGRLMHPLDDLNETRGYWLLEEEALENTVWRTRFG